MQDRRDDQIILPPQVHDAIRRLAGARVFDREAGQSIIDAVAMVLSTALAPGQSPYWTQITEGVGQAGILAPGAPDLLTPSAYVLRRVAGANAVTIRPAADRACPHSPALVLYYNQQRRAEGGFWASPDVRDFIAAGNQRRHVSLGIRHIPDSDQDGQSSQARKIREALRLMAERALRQPLVDAQHAALLDLHHAHRAGRQQLANQVNRLMAKLDRYERSLGADGDAHEGPDGEALARLELALVTAQVDLVILDRHYEPVSGLLRSNAHDIAELRSLDERIAQLQAEVPRSDLPS